MSIFLSAPGPISCVPWWPLELQLCPSRMENAGKKRAWPNAINKREFGVCDGSLDVANLSLSIPGLIDVVLS